MKKLYFLLASAAALLTVPSFAQKASVGFSGGVTLANQYGKKGGKLITDDQKIGYTVGLEMDAPMCKGKFSFHPGLFYAQKGRIENVSYREKTYWSLRYAELQANFLYNMSHKKTNTFYVGGGPAFAVDLPSFAETRLLNGDPLLSNDFVKNGKRSVNFGTLSSSDFVGPDWGVNLMLGYRLANGWSVGYNYTIGLRNINPNATGNDGLRNHFMGLRIGYLVKNK